MRMEDYLERALDESLDDFKKIYRLHQNADKEIGKIYSIMIKYKDSKAAKKLEVLGDEMGKHITSFMESIENK